MIIVGTPCDGSLFYAENSNSVEINCWLFGLKNINNDADEINNLFIHLLMKRDFFSLEQE